MWKTLGTKLISWLSKKGAVEGTEGAAKHGILSTAKDAATLGVAGGVGLGAVNVALDPKDGFVINTITDVITATTNAAKEAGVDSGFQGFYKFFEKLAKLIESFTGKGSMQGMTNWARKGMGQDIETPASATDKTVKTAIRANVNDSEPPNTQDKSLTQSFTGYAKGLVADAEFTLKGGLNLANAAGNGAVVGTASTLSWVGGQALDILNVGNVFSDTDFSTKFSKATSEATNKLWEKTIGGPDLNGHWAHALNKTSELAVPAMGALKIGKALSKMFGFANATTKTGGLVDKVVTNAPAFTVGTP